MRNLKECVSDYRDKEIAHEKSPKAMKATMFSHGTTSTTWIASTKIYPTEKNKQVESKEVDQAMTIVDKYIEQIIKYIRMNSAKTILEKSDLTK